MTVFEKYWSITWLLEFSTKYISAKSHQIINKNSLCEKNRKRFRSKKNKRFQSYSLRLQISCKYQLCNSKLWLFSRIFTLSKNFLGVYSSANNFLMVDLILNFSTNEPCISDLSHRAECSFQNWTEYSLYSLWASCFWD